MQRFSIVLMAVALLSVCAGPLEAVPIDLSPWTAQTLDYTGGQPAGNWVLSSGNTVVTQTVNADPSFYLNNLNQTSYSMDGTWKVTTGSDDDFMGFVFGYKNSSNFYLFDWKQGAQDAGSPWGDADEGMTIRKMTGATGNGLTDLSLKEFWDNKVDSGDSHILDTNHGGTEGWVDNVEYSFHLDFNVTPGQFDIEVKRVSDDVTLWDVSVADTTFTSGQFGFYNYSQQAVQYAGFAQTGGRIVPEASSFIIWCLLGLCGTGIAWWRRRKA